jgi:hypothetical protein
LYQCSFEVAIQTPEVMSSGDQEKQDSKEVASDAKAATRSRVSEDRVVGLVIEWRGYMGWIQPLSSMEHDAAKKHKGRIYLNVKDIVKGKGSRVKEGSIVEFYVYTDHDGLGAEECQMQTVVRLTLPHAEVNKWTYTPAWSEYLYDSQYYPTFLTEHNVLLRKYTWPLPFAVLELWGDVDTLTKAAVHLASLGKTEDQELDLRLLFPEAAVAKVEALPIEPKLSEQAVISKPIRCRSLNLSIPAEKCKEATKCFLEAMSLASVGA